MLITLHLLFSVLIGSLLALPPDIGRSTAAGTTVANPAAKRVERMIEEMERREKAGNSAGRTYVLAEADLNAYLTAKIEERERRDVELLTVKMKDGSFLTHLRVDLDKVKIEGDPLALALFKTLLSGKQTIEVDGRLETSKGKGAYHIQSATINGLTVPVSLVTIVLSAIGSRQDPPFDPTSPFELPYRIQTITVEAGKTTLRT